MSNQRTLISQGFSLPPNIPKINHSLLDELDAWHGPALLKVIRDWLRPDLAGHGVNSCHRASAVNIVEAQAVSDGVKDASRIDWALRYVRDSIEARELIATWIGLPPEEIWAGHHLASTLILSEQPAWSERAAAKAATPPVATSTPVAEAAAPNAGSSTLERAFEAATTAARPTIERAVNEAVMIGAIRHTQALLGQLLAEEVAATPWARWKSASRGLVDWWAARFMSALYIAPKRKHPKKVQLSSHQNETGKACPTCGGQA